MKDSQLDTGTSPYDICVDEDIDNVEECFEFVYTQVDGDFETDDFEKFNFKFEG